MCLNKWGNFRKEIININLKIIDTNNDNNGQGELKNGEMGGEKRKEEVEITG